MIIQKYIDTATRWVKSKWGIPYADIIAYGQSSNNGYTYQKAVSSYLGEDIVYSATDLVASAVSSVPIRAMIRKGDKSEPAPFDHPLNKLMRHPNPMQRGNTYRYGMVCFRLLGGKGYSWVNTGAIDPLDSEAEPLELWALAPTAAELRQENGASWYQVNTSGGSTCGGVSIPTQNIPIDAMTGRSNMIDWASFNPKTLCNGVSPLMAADRNVDIYSYGNIWNRTYFKQGCRPSTALVSKEGIPDKSYNRMKKELDEVYSGLERGNGRPIILDNGVMPQELSKSAKDSDFIQSHNQMQRDIVRTYKIPPILLDLGDGTAFATADKKDAKICLWDDVIVPLTDDLVAEYNQNLTPRYRDPNLFLEADYSKIPALEPRRIELWKRANEATFLDVNEKRDMVGMPPTPGGDVIFVPANSVPLEMASFVPPSE